MIKNANQNKTSTKAAGLYTPIGIIFLALILLSFCLYINWKLNHDTKQIIIHTERMGQQLVQEEWPEALSTHQELTKDWKKVQTTWALFTDHQRLDQVSESLIRLYYALKMKDSYDAQIELTTLDYLLTNFSEKERLNLKNFF